MWLTLGIFFLVLSVILCSIGIAVFLANGSAFGVPQPTIFKPLIIVPGATYVGLDRVLIPYSFKPVALTEDGYTYTINYDSTIPLQSLYYTYESTLFPASNVEEASERSRSLVWYRYINGKITFYFPTSLENTARVMVSIAYTLQGNIVSLPEPTG